MQPVRRMAMKISFFTFACMGIPPNDVGEKYFRTKIEPILKSLSYDVHRQTEPLLGERCRAGRGGECTSQQILDTNHKKIYNKKLSVSQISVRNATCDIELASDSLTNKLDAVH